VNRAKQLFHLGSQDTTSSFEQLQKESLCNVGWDWVKISRYWASAGSRLVVTEAVFQTKRNLRLPHLRLTLGELRYAEVAAPGMLDWKLIAGKVFHCIPRHMLLF
jgi:hypothetical protein